MTHDPTTYENPHEFRPERFLSMQATGIQYNNKDSTVPFGFGRRICPGMHMADASLFINIACIFAALDITTQTGTDGRPIDPSSVEFNSGLIM